MISVQNLKVEFSSQVLFDNVSFVVNNKDKIALVGKNGAGKSTLLKIFAGIQNPTSGQVSRSSDITIGYLPQTMNLSDCCTAKEEVQKAFSHIDELDKQIDELNVQLAERTDYESESYQDLIDTLTHKNDLRAMYQSENYEAEIEKTLIGLGFERTDFDRPTSEFSGGWRMRIELAKILLQRPDVLLLDEPTNHLDIESIQWLENFLKTQANMLVLVSHDKAFIDNVTNRTIEISCGKIYDYNVNYSHFIELRKERIEQLEKIERIEIDEVDNSHLRLKFPPAPRSGDYPVIANDLSKSYGDHNVFHDCTFTIKRGEKVAFVGKNGAGKSTLVKCIMHEIPFNGELKIGHNVEIGYFAQNQAMLLDENLTVHDTIDYAATGEIRTRINDILGAFMFGGAASEKKVKVLSGGERSRLAMIQLLLQPVNLLILDEPTNHLDIRTKDILKEAIKEFDGTVIVVSHDRDFLDGLVDKVYEFGNGLVKEHLCGIYEFLEYKKLSSLQELEKNDAPQKDSPAKTEEVSQSKLSYLEQKEAQKRIRHAEKRIKELETKINTYESEIKEIENLLSSGTNTDQSIYTKHQELNEALENAMMEWETANEEFETLQNND